ncbi:MAG: hypothetical protein Q7J28_14945 [Caulobacter sp.]|nr:hypothetical protein [Caulobacter sp.]
MKYRNWIVAAIVGLLAYSGAKIIGQSAWNAWQFSDSNVARVFDQEMRQSPFMVALSEAYPAEWADFRADMIAKIRDRTDSSADIAAAGHAFSRNFMLSKASIVASAPSQNLQAMIASEEQLLNYLQSVNVSLCADYAMVGLGPSAEISKEGRRFLEEAAVSRLRAIVAAEANPQSRPAMSAADVDALTMAMRKAGAAGEAVEGFASGDISRLSETEKCATAVHMYRALEALPSDRADRIIAEISSAAGTTAAE